MRYTKKLKKLKDAKLELVEYDVNGYPSCKLHGAMNKLTEDGIWRCVTIYKYFHDEKGQLRFRENNCCAGGQE